MTKNDRETAEAKKAGRVALVVFARVASALGLVIAYYVIAFFSAVQLVPLTMGFVKSGTGVTMDMPVETVVAVWIAPSLFLIALLFALVLVTMRALYRGRKRVITRIAEWAGLADTTPAPAFVGRARLAAKTATA